MRQAAIHAKYRDGSFESVVETLEAFQQAHANYRREDSLFIAKHLAVIYASNPPRREKGKYYMRRLLELNPTADLMDMYVGDEIDKVWEKVRTEYFAAKGGPPLQSSPLREEPQVRKDNSTLKIAAWTGAGLVASGLLGYYLFSGDEPEGRSYKIDARTQQP